MDSPNNEGNGAHDRSSNIGVTTSKINGPDNDMFSGAAAAKTASDARTFDEFGASNAEFEKHCYYRGACVCVRRVINVIGSIAALLNVALDIVYAYKVSFAS